MGHSKRVGADVGDESTKFRKVVQSLRLLLSDELKSCCALGTNGCLVLRYRPFPLDQGFLTWGAITGGSGEDHICGGQR